MSRVEENNKTMALFRQVSPIFQVLSDQNRQDIVLLLSNNDELNVGQITQQVSLSRPAVSHHLKQLRQAGLVKIRKTGKENFYYLTIGDSLGLLKDLVERIENHCVIQ